MLTHFSKNNFKRSSFSMVARYFRESTIIYGSIEFHFQVLLDDIRELHVLVWFSWSLCIRLAIICLTGLTIVCLSGLMWSRFSKQILRVPHLQCSKSISETLCRHLSNFKSLIVVVG